MAPVEQLHRCTHLGFTDFDFCGQLPDDLLHGWANSLKLEKIREAREFATATFGNSPGNALAYPRKCRSFLECRDHAPRPIHTPSMKPVPFPVRTECPPGACVCDRDALLQAPDGDTRILQLTQTEEKKLLTRLEGITSLADLRRMQERMEQQLGIRITVTPSPNEVRTLRGIAILVHEQPGLCRKTRQSIPAAIKKGMDQRPEIAYELLDEGGLFSSP